MYTNNTKRVLPILMILCIMFSLMAAPAYPTAAAGKGKGQGLWKHVDGTPPPARSGVKPAIKPHKFNGNRLNRSGMADLLATAPFENGKFTQNNSLVISMTKE